jgi:fucose 4-O-acetylase-like acetyltransferase
MIAASKRWQTGIQRRGADVVKKRIEWIDISKGIAILLVLLGHTLTSDSRMWQIIYSFHMPLFFLLAGYTFKPKAFKDILQASALRLLVPYLICFVLITSIALLWQSSFSLDWLIPQLKAIFFASAIPVKYFNLPQVGIIWFFWALFLSRIWFNSVIRFCDKVRVPEIARFIFFLALSVIGGLVSNYVFLPFALDLVTATTFFIYLGYLLKARDFFSRTRVNIVAFVVALAVWIACLIYTPYSVETPFTTRLYGNPLSAFSGTLVTIYLSMLIARYIPGLKHYLLFMGANSIIVLFIHAIGGNLVFWSSFEFFKSLPSPEYAIFIARTIFITLLMYLILLNPLVRNKKEAQG